MTLKEWQASQVRNSINVGETITLENAILNAIKFLGHSAKREDFIYQASKDTDIDFDELIKVCSRYIQKLSRSGKIANAGLPGYWYAVPTRMHVAAR